VAEARWRRFWFAPVPPHLYALMRMAFGAIGVLQLVLVRDVAAFWAPDGLIPPSSHQTVSAWLLSRGLGYQAGILFLSLEFACLAAMTIGFRSRGAVVLSFVGALFEGWWNRWPQYGGFALWRDLLFCLMWVDSGRVWSIDAVVRRARTPITTSLEEASQPIWPLRIAQFQIGLMYLTSAFWKVQNPAWQDGSALHFFLLDDAAMRFPGGPPAGADGLLTVATYGVLVWEFAMPFLLFNGRTRKLALLSGVLIHIGMWAALDIQLFSLIVLAGYLAFVDPYAFSSGTKVFQFQPFVGMPRSQDARID
jgi:hypothetical protein